MKCLTSQLDPWLTSSQHSDEKPKQEGSPTESQDVTPEEEKADAGAPEVQGTDLETENQELASVSYADPEPTGMPETGEEKPPV